MADAITIKALQDASLDAKSLEDVVNGDDAKQVITRKGETYPSVKKSIKALFENGGLPATPFATKALMTASALIDGDYAMVTDDPVSDNNALYIKKNGVWIESDYSVKTTIKNAIGEVLDFEDGANIYDKNRKVWGYQVSSSGAIILAEGRSISPQIPVIAGQDYFISSVVRNAGLIFLDKNRNEILSSYSNLKNIKVTAPATAYYLVINIDHPSYISNQVMVNKGSVAQTYKEYDGEKLKEGVLPSTLLTSSNLADNVKNLGVVRDYEIESDNKNLFNPADIQIDKFLSTNNGAISKGVGWSISGFIPVTAGQTYTLSGTRARQGLSFFSEASDAGVPALLYDNTTTLPITVTAPEGANFAVFALESTTAKGYSNIQFEKGGDATNYEPYTDSRILINPEYIASSSAFLSSKSKLVVNDKYNASIECSNTVNIKHQITPNTLGSINRSTVFNFWSDELNGVQVRNPTDDAAPLRADDATIGANHGYSRTEITGTHGKTYADVGSVWTDGSEQFVLIDVASPTVLSVTARSDNSGMREPQLTHVSGATNTAVIDAASKTYKQWYPVIKNRTLKTLVDGTPISLDNAATYAYEDCVAFHESYEVMAKADIVEWVIANGKKQLDSYDAAPSILCNYSYVFDVDGGCTIYASITTYKSIPFADWMLTQSTVLTTGNVSYYVPKTVEFTQDSTTYDFSKLQPVSAPLASSVYFDAAKNEVGANPVDRLIQLSDGVAYATGYLPLLDAAPDVRATNASNKYLEVRNNSLKVYPRVIDNSTKTTLNAGDSYAAIAYRKYFERDNKRTAKYIVRSNVADYLYLDWHSAKTDVIELPDDLIGRNFTVHEKSSNVTLLSKFATNNIAATIDNSKSYGYLVLMFEK